MLGVIRDDPAVAAIAGTRVSAVAEAPPSVKLIDTAATRRPFGPGSGRIGMQLVLMVARCYGPDSPTGAITARQLAGTVSDALDGKGAQRSGTRYVARANAPEIDGMSRDPETKWPYYDVRLEIYAAAQAVPIA